jgi:hypothetical protein
MKVELHPRRRTRLSSFLQACNAVTAATLSERKVGSGAFAQEYRDSLIAGDVFDGKNF